MSTGPSLGFELESGVLWTDLVGTDAPRLSGA